MLGQRSEGEGDTEADDGVCGECGRHSARIRSVSSDCLARNERAVLAGGRVLPLLSRATGAEASSAECAGECLDRAVGLKLTELSAAVLDTASGD